jgi:hypothetical protein
MWKLGLRPQTSFSGNICFKFSAFFLCSVVSSEKYSHANHTTECTDPAGVDILPMFELIESYSFLYLPFCSTFMCTEFHRRCCTLYLWMILFVYCLPADLQPESDVISNGNLQVKINVDVFNHDLVDVLRMTLSESKSSIEVTTCTSSNIFVWFGRDASKKGAAGLKENLISMVGSLKMNTTLEYSTRVVQEGDRRCKKSTLNDLAYLSPLRRCMYSTILPADGPIV